MNLLELTLEMKQAKLPVLQAQQIKITGYVGTDVRKIVNTKHTHSFFAWPPYKCPTVTQPYKAYILVKVNKMLPEVCQYFDGARAMTI